MARRGLTEEQKTQIITLYGKGLSDNQIGRAVGKSGSTIQSFRVRMKLPANQAGIHTNGNPPETQPVHWSKALTPEQWEVVARFFKAVIDRQVYGRLVS